MQVCYDYLYLDNDDKPLQYLKHQDLLDIVDTECFADIVEYVKEIGPDHELNDIVDPGITDVLYWKDLDENAEPDIILDEDGKPHLREEHPYGYRCT